MPKGKMPKGGRPPCFGIIKGGGSRDDIGDEDGDMCDNENNDGEPNMRRVSKKPTKYAHLRLPLRTTTATPCRT